MSEKRGPDLGASFVASGDLSGSQFRLVAFDGNNVFLPTSGMLCAGVLQNKPKHGEHASVIGIGYSKVQVGAALNSRAPFQAGSSGFALAVDSGSWTQGVIITTTVSGEIGEALVFPGNRHA